MRTGIIGVFIGLSVAGGVFATLFQSAPQQQQFLPRNLTSEPITLEQVPEDFRTSVKLDVEPRVLPAIRFDEPPLTQKVVQASFVNPEPESTEIAPPPRKQGVAGRLPLQAPDDAF
jgi:hypothetical protein